MSLKNFFGFNFQTLKQFLSADLKIDEKKTSMRAKQLWQAVYKKGLEELNHLTTLPVELRDELISKITLEKPKIADTQTSEDGTIKWLIELLDGNKVECVFIPEKTRGTLCISSQVGCSLSCVFCATGRLKLLRNLTAGEIVDQVVYLRNQAENRYKTPLSNIVYMGMGEPLLNYKNVLRSTKMLCSEKGLGISPRRITVSTAGIAKMIRKLGDDEVRFNLALSLHAANDEKRNKLMEINETNNLEELSEALIYFHEKTGTRVTFE